MMGIMEREGRRQRNEWMQKAVFVSSKEGNMTLGIDELCKKMVAKAKEGTPVRTERDGDNFVIDANMPLGLALKEWCEQVYKPSLQKGIDAGELTPEKMVKWLSSTAEFSRIDNTAGSFQEAALAESLVLNFPERVGDLTLLQVLNGYHRASLDNLGKMEDALDSKIKKYIEGEETFPHTLENIVALQKLNDCTSHRKLRDPESLTERIKRSEKDMMQSLKPEDLRGMSDELFSKGMEISNRHMNSSVDTKQMFISGIRNRGVYGKGR